MPSFQDPVEDADEAREAMRGLAYATRHIERAENTYPVLGSVTRTVEGLQQVLRQLAAWHHAPGPARPATAGTGRWGPLTRPPPPTRLPPPPRQRWMGCGTR